jgi:hypothetical protein
MILVGQPWLQLVQWEEMINRGRLVLWEELETRQHEEQYRLESI